MQEHDESRQPPLTLAHVYDVWWPLAASWLLMGTEMSLVSAAIARLDDAAFHLAAFGGLVFPVSLVIEAPIIMMLAASTALSADRDAYARLLRFCTVMGLGCTLVHALVAFTPLYDSLLVRFVDPPAGAIEPGRLGMQWMTIWTWAIADRRLHQGLLIRFGRSRAVVVGTLVRLLVMVSMLGAGVWHGELPGIVVACAALSGGVLAEMATARVMAAPVIRGPLASAPLGEPLKLGRLLRFYVPLAVTPILSLVALPIGSASIARMPLPLDSLAAWPPVNGLVFMSRSVGIAFNEVVVSLAGRPGARPVLRRFAVRLALLTSVALALVALTPLSRGWFSSISGLTHNLVSVASAGLPAGILLPGATVFVSLYTGRLVHAQQTRAIPESVGLSLAVTTGVLMWGVWSQSLSGVPVTLMALTLGTLAQVAWLRLRGTR